MKLLSSRRYGLEDQRAFARFSGDYNPLHVDPEVAHREIFGAVVVHGVHALLDALESYARRLEASNRDGIELLSVSARFPGPIYLDQSVKTVLQTEKDGYAKLTASTQGQTSMSLEIEWRPGSSKAGVGCPPLPNSTGEQPANPAFEELAGRSGLLPLFLDPSLATSEFPRLSTLLAPHTLAAILATTRLVGMECPGLQSIFSALNLRFQPNAAPRDAVSYEVKTADPRMSAVRIALTSSFVEGELQTFYRPLPQKQPSLSEVTEHVKPGEFEGQRALIVGGSRGIGEVTAKIIAAGGGTPILTYRSSTGEAQRLADEIAASGSTCTVLKCDVSKPRACVEELKALGAAPTHVYFLASPKIFVRKSAVFEDRLFREFYECYVNGLFKTYRALRAAWPQQPFIFFYPSSTALDEHVKGLAEYAAAKSAGEILCVHLEQSDPKLKILIRRLPRIATDQTLTLMRVPAADALEVMLPLMRELGGFAG